jgi:hypothetical protein
LLERAGLQLGAQGGSTLQLLGERGNCSQSRGTNVVFHSFHIMINHTIVYTEQSQELSE